MSRATPANRISPEKEAEIRELLLTGLGHKKVADHVGCSKHTVWRVSQEMEQTAPVDSRLEKLISELTNAARAIVKEARKNPDISQAAKDLKVLTEAAEKIIRSKRALGISSATAAPTSSAAPAPPDANNPFAVILGGRTGTG